MPTVVKRTRRAERAVQRRELRAVSVPDLRRSAASGG
jgi:hypothetical protein